MILLWGLPADAPLSAVYHELSALRADVVLLDQVDGPRTEVDLIVGSEVTGSVRVLALQLELTEIEAVYLRPYDSRMLPEIEAAGRDSLAWEHALVVDDTLMCWAELTDALVVNRPSAMAPNCSKPLQGAWLKQLGFSVPDTLVTTDPEAVRDFWERHGEVIYKSVSSVRSRVSRLGPEHRGRLKDVANCPSQFQQYIPGTDFRVHVVGDTAFACEVRSEADDYRYPTLGMRSAEIRSVNLPAWLEERCIASSLAMGLHVSGIDLRRATWDETLKPEC